MPTEVTEVLPAGTPADAPIRVGSVREVEIEPISQEDVDDASRIFRDRNPSHPRGLVQEALLQGVIGGAIFDWIDSSSLKSDNVVRRETYGAYTCPDDKRTVMAKRQFRLRLRVAELEAGRIKIDFEVYRPSGEVLYAGWIRGSAKV